MTVRDYPQRLSEMWAKHLAPRAADAPTVISTFAGCGGSSLGYSMAGFRELFAVEWDENAATTFRANFGEHTPVFVGDIRSLTVEDVLQQTNLQPGQLDVFDGSPPCQGFSTVGHRQLDDPRNQLFQEFVRLLRGLQPRAFVMENVTGMVKGKMRLIFVEILEALKSAGYQVRAQIVEAKQLEVPQIRQRVIFIGVRDDLVALPTFPASICRPYTVREAIAHLDSDEVPLANPANTLSQMWHLATKGGPLYDARLRRGQRQSIRLALDSPANTLITLFAPWHYRVPRELTNQEIALLGSFPPEFNWTQTPARLVLKQVGNSVPPMMMYHVARELASTLRGCRA